MITAQVPSAVPAWPTLGQARASLLGLDEPALAGCCGRRIGVLIPADNAASTLEQVLQRIPPEVWRNLEEVVVLDDASQDATYEQARGLAGLLPKLRVRRNARKLGYGGSRKAGLRYFLELGFDIVVLLPGDGRYAPELLARLYHPLVAGATDAVFGSRLAGLDGASLRDGLALRRYTGYRILSACQNRALGLRLSEFHSGYRAYRLEALRHIDFSRMSDHIDFDTEMIIKLRHQRYSIREVPIPARKEDGRLPGFQDAWNGMRALWRYRQTCRSLVCHPAFREYFVRHPLKTARYSSHDYARRMTGSGKEVLDLGCGEGFLAAELARAGNRVTAVDCREQASLRAPLERYVRADLEQAGWAQKLDGKRFDRILLLDVLEHLRQGGRVLAECRPLLREGGAAIISLPNVANIAVRLSLLFGHFDYRERGILDRGHLRFFTRRTARRFVVENGYEIVQERTTVIPLDLALGLEASGRLHRWLNLALASVTKLLPGLFGYQFVFLARPSPGPVG